MARRTRDSLVSHVAHILEHLLKLHYEPSEVERALRERQWKLDLAVHRNEAIDLIEASPSRRNQLDEVIAKAYPRARRYAGTVMENLHDCEETLPSECPRTSSEILHDDFFPDPARRS